jgi:hypothetical protein
MTIGFSMVLGLAAALAAAASSGIHSSTSARDTMPIT